MIRGLTRASSGSPLRTRLGQLSLTDASDSADPSAQQLVVTLDISWAGLCPSNDESAGKRRSTIAEGAARETGDIEIRDRVVPGCRRSPTPGLRGKYPDEIDLRGVA